MLKEILNLHRCLQYRRVNERFKKISNLNLRIIGIITLCFSVAACATSRETYTASGEKGHSINCSGTALNWGMCYEKAGEICGAKGFDIIAGGADQGAVITGSQFGLFGGTVMNRSMIIKCKQ
jgi:hypothetical protein